MERFLVGALIVIVAIIVYSQQALMTENRELKRKVEELSQRFANEDESPKKK